MTRVLKRDGATGAPDVHSLVSAWNATAAVTETPAPAIDPELAALKAEQQALKRRLEEQEALLSEARAEVDTAFRKGEAKGREAGLREAADQGEQRLAHLEAGIAKAHAAFVQTLDGLERLAPVLAHDALAAILGQADTRPHLVAAIVRNQVQTLEARSLLHIEVSAADFPDDDALAALDGTSGGSGPSVYASVSLKSGECRIRLKLGTLDVGLERQWTELSALLRDMAEGGES